MTSRRDMAGASTLVVILICKVSDVRGPDYGSNIGVTFLYIKPRHIDSNDSRENVKKLRISAAFSGSCCFLTCNDGYKQSYGYSTTYKE